MTEGSARPGSATVDHGAVGPAGNGWWPFACLWLERTAIGLSVVSVAVLFVAGIVAFPLSVDGGWYSYPAYAWSIGRDAFSSQLGLDAARQLQGFAAVFGFETTSSIRLFYASAWFRLFGADLTSLRVLSLAEFAVGALLAYALFRAVFRDRRLALLTVALLVTDKAFILGAATDFRPDVALLAGGCALFIILDGGRGEHRRTLAAALVAVVVAAVALTAVIPLALVFVAQGVRALQSREHRNARLLQLGVVAVVAGVAFLGRQAVFYWLLDPAVSIADPVDAGARIFALLEEGPGRILEKEATRFTDYFWVSNLPLLLAIGLLTLTLAIRGTDGSRVPKSLWGPLAGLAAAALVMAVLDPHETGQHMLPVMPFVLLLAVKLERLRSATFRAAYASLVLLSALASIALGARQIVATDRSGTGNAWREAALEELFPDDRSYLALGPTELWPLLPHEQDVVLADLTRNPTSLEDLELVWSDVDYVILNPDYHAPAWIAALEELIGSAPCTLVSRPPQLVVVAPRPCGFEESP